MHRLAIAHILIATLLLAGCGTAYYGMPPRTLQKDEGYLGIGMAWNSLEPWGAWNDVSINGHVWWGTSDTDAVGLAFSHVDLPFFFPDVSYAHSWAPDGHGRRVIGSLHAGLGWRWNPVLEAGLGYSHDSGSFAHLAWAGAGLWTNGTVTPSLRYIAQYSEVRGEIAYAPGRMATALRVARGSYFADSDTAGFRLARDDVFSWRTEPDPEDAGWYVRLRDGRKIEMMPDDPYVDAFAETFARRFIEKFPPFEGAELYWIYLEDEYYPAEFDMVRIADRFESGGILHIRQDPALTELAVQRYDHWWRDLSVGLWWSWYDPAVLE